jgi:CBS-domain-containing membrane protein
MLTTTAKQLISAELHSIAPGCLLVELERELLEKGAAAFPVMQEGELVGVVSRSDLLRQICVERSYAENVWAPSPAAVERDLDEETNAIAWQVGRRMETLCAGDIMSRDVITVELEATAQEIASKMTDSRVHELVVLHGGEVVGVVESLDLLKLMAKGAS